MQKFKAVARGVPQRAVPRIGGNARRAFERPREGPENPGGAMSVGVRCGSCPSARRHMLLHYFSITWPPVTGMAWPVSYFCSTQ